MENEFVGEYVVAKKAINEFDVDTINQGVNQMKEIEERMEMLVRKIEEAKSLCSRDSLYIQGYSMEDTLEEYQKLISDSAYYLGDLAHSIETSTHRSIVKKQIIYNEEAKALDEQEKIKHMNGAM